MYGQCDAAASRRLCGVIVRPSAAVAASKLSRRKLRLRSGVEFAEGKTRSEGAGLSGPSSSPTPTAALKITPCEKPFCISDERSTTSPPMRGTTSVDDGDTRSRQGFMDLTDIPLPQDIQVFTCGPLSFMRHVRSTLLSRGVPPARIRYEVFGPDLWAAQTSSDSGS